MRRGITLISHPSQKKIGGLLFLSLLALLPTFGGIAQAAAPRPIDEAVEFFESPARELVAIDYQKAVDREVLLQREVTLADVWSFLYTYRAEGEKLFKDAWLTFQQEATFDQWKAYWPHSLALCVAWQEADATWRFAAVSAIAVTSNVTQEVEIAWYFNQWKVEQYHVYTLRAFFLEKFIPAVARAPFSEAEFEQLGSVLRTGDKDGQFVIKKRLFGDVSWVVPVGLVIAALGYLLRKQK